MQHVFDQNKASFVPLFNSLLYFQHYCVIVQRKCEYEITDCLIDLTYQTNFFSWESPGVGTFLVALPIQGVVCFAILFMIEFNIFRVLKNRVKSNWFALDWISYFLNGIHGNIVRHLILVILRENCTIFLRHLIFKQFNRVFIIIFWLQFVTVKLLTKF